mmetsp:Transcript_10305/g.27491  ORF Transcript_10305/g.27491 Transcript_10305/m.27491 type:complete len:262 (-) Transcript_10305:35-820(-)
MPEVPIGDEPFRDPVGLDRAVDPVYVEARGGLVVDEHAQARTHKFVRGEGVVGVALRVEPDDAGVLRGARALVPRADLDVGGELVEEELHGAVEVVVRLVQRLLHRHGSQVLPGAVVPSNMVSLWPHQFREGDDPALANPREHVPATLQLGFHEGVGLHVGVELLQQGRVLSLRGIVRNRRPVDHRFVPAQLQGTETAAAILVGIALVVSGQGTQGRDGLIRRRLHARAKAASEDDKELHLDLDAGGGPGETRVLVCKRFV